MNFSQYLEIKNQLNSLNENELSEEHLKVKLHLQNRLNEEDILNEGLLGSIWKWLKLNFSPTASKIKDLAQEYEKVLTEEMESDAYSKKLRKDILNGKASSKLAIHHFSDIRTSAIRNKMRQVSKNDPIYTELVDSLVSEIDYRVSAKKFDSILDDPQILESPDIKAQVKTASTDAKAAEKKASKEVENISAKLSVEERGVVTEMHKIIKGKFNTLIKEYKLSKSDLDVIIALIVKRGFFICKNLEEQSRTVKEGVVSQLSEACVEFYLNSKEIYEDAKDEDLINTIKQALEFNTKTLYVSSLKERFISILEKTYKTITKEFKTYEGYEDLLREQKRHIANLDDNQTLKFKKLNTSEYSEKSKTELELEFETILLGLIKGDKLPSELSVSKVARQISVISSINSTVLDLLDSDEKEYKMLKACYNVLSDPETNTEEDYKIDLLHLLHEIKK